MYISNVQICKFTNGRNREKEKKMRNGREWEAEEEFIMPL